MDRLEELKELIKERKKIVLTELDERILEAVKLILKDDLIDIIMLGDKEELKDSYKELAKCLWINPKDSVYLDEFTESLYELRKNKGLTKEESRNLLINDYMYFACMLVYTNKADGIVSGICHSSANTIRPALQIIKGKDKIVSSFMLMDTNNEKLGDKGLFIFSDCGLNQNPTSEELSIICKQSIESYNMLIKRVPKVAFLSYSTNGSSKHTDVDKVRMAKDLAVNSLKDVIIDGEIQLDAAIDKDIQEMKYPNSKIKGDANILIFPNLDAGNIGYKLVERFANAKAYGPLLQGLNKAVNDLSRGSSVMDVYGVIIITALEAQNY